MATSVVDALFSAAKQGREEDIRELLQMGGVDWSVKDSLGNTPLHYAAAAGHIAVVRLLVESKKVDVNVTNNQGDTPLHKAVGGKESEQQIEVVTFLVEAGAKVEIKNNQGYTAADVARTPSLKEAITAGISVPGWNPESSDDEDDKDEDEDDDDDDDDD